MLAKSIQPQKTQRVCNWHPLPVFYTVTQSVIETVTALHNSVNYNYCNIQIKIKTGVYQQIDNMIASCSNPNCQITYDIKEAQDQASQRGIALAFCEDSVFQAVECRVPGCGGKVVFRCEAGRPALDLRGLFLVPNPTVLQNAVEQAWILQNQKGWHDFLRFQFIPAWDDSVVSVKEFKDAFNGVPLFFIPSFPDIPLVMSEEEFNSRLDQENISGKIKLRRFVSGTPRFRKLLTLLAPYKIREISGPEVVHADGVAPDDLLSRRKAWKSLIEEAAGQTFEHAVATKLVSKGIGPSDQSEIISLTDRELFFHASSLRERLWSIVSRNGFSEQLDDFFRKTFRSVFYPVCTELALADKREELLKWPDEVEPGKALFIDAPMGLGKTFAIVKALVANADLSAVVFMPTNRLCRELIESLKARIAVRLGYSEGDIESQRKRAEDDSGKPLLDDEGLMQYLFKRDFLEKEVYYADGINPSECPKADEIVSQYKKNWIKKFIVCKKCELKSNCRFLHHYKKARQARIIVTTHQQHDHFYQNSGLHYWINDGKRHRRDFFIIDEDLIFSQLYQPVNLDYDELRAFVGTVTDFLQKYDGISHLRNKIDLLFSHINKCDQTSIIRPIDPEFIFPEAFIKEWGKSLPKQPFIIPEYMKWSGIVGNHLKLIEHAVRFGAVVEKWGARFKIHLPNPRSYDLSKAPPHVFFDGTMLNERFLKNKLSGVEFKRWRVDIECPWEIRIFQNTNSDLPAKWIERDKPKVQEFLKSTINNVSVDKKIFLITTNAITKAYLQEFIDIEFQDRHFISGYYGNVRGINEAKECDLGIMLGSFMPSDSVEIAMALELIDSNHLEKDITATINNLWTWTDTNGVRKYKEDFSIIGQMAKAFRYSEHRQALARTRYLFHDVDFYMISKDRVSDYDPFLSNTIDDQYRTDLFQPRPKRPEAEQKYDEIAEKVMAWLQTHNTVNATAIHEKYGIRRQTVGRKLKEMHTNGVLVYDGDKKTTYRLQNPNT